jgi:salicylate hydroxylase
LGHKDWTILIGDAAHAMLPTEGQGASQTSEGTEALGAFFENVMDYPLLAVVNSTLMEVFNALYERANLIQQYSRQARPATENGLKKVTLRPDEFMDYNCKYSGVMDWI